jgi:hypothetical protein
MIEFLLSIIIHYLELVIIENAEVIVLFVNDKHCEIIELKYLALVD